MSAPESPARLGDDVAIKEFFRVRQIRTDKLDKKNPFENFEYYIRKFETAVEDQYAEPEHASGYEHARSFVFRLMAGSLPASLPEGPDPEKGRDLDPLPAVADAARQECWVKWKDMEKFHPGFSGWVATITSTQTEKPTDEQPGTKWVRMVEAKPAGAIAKAEQKEPCPDCAKFPTASQYGLCVKHHNERIRADAAAEAEQSLSSVGAMKKALRYLDCIFSKRDDSDPVVVEFMAANYDEQEPGLTFWAADKARRELAQSPAGALPMVEAILDAFERRPVEAMRKALEIEIVNFTDTVSHAGHQGWKHNMAALTERILSIFLPSALADASREGV